MKETQSGDGPWRISYLDGAPYLVEIWFEPGIKIAFGDRKFTSSCAACGGPVSTVSEHNDEAELCDTCLLRIGEAL